MYSTYANSYARNSSLSGASNAVWIIISIVLAIVGGLVIYFTFLKKSNEGKYTGFLGWMYDFLTFKKLTIENVLKLLYLMVAIFITLSSFAVISVSFLSFLIYLVLGNLIVRIAYEMALIAIIICRNTTDISKKLNEISKNNDEKHD